jgi:hypothetical protein
MRKDMPFLVLEAIVLVCVLAAPILFCCMLTVDVFGHSPKVTVALNGKCCQEIASRKQGGATVPCGVISIEPNFGAKSISLIVCNSNRESLTYVWNALDRNAIKRFTVTRGQCEHTCFH